MTELLRETNFKKLGKKSTGKVRDIYEQDDKILLVTTDRHSSFDRLIAHVPHKGQVLNQISAFWFEQTKDIVPNHVLDVPDPNVTVAKKCKPLPVEAVVRGYLTGVTDTSLWTHYKAGKRDFGNFKLQDGMNKNQQLLRPVFTPSTKSDTHDRSLSPLEIVNEGILSRKTIDAIQQTALALYDRGVQIAKERGLILVDTKYEFGVLNGNGNGNGDIILIDEIHTPDSSRYWQFDSYSERIEKGEEPEYFDKEFLRLWFKEHSDPYKDETLPEAPPELVGELSKRYIRMYEQITGETFKAGAEPIVPRIEKNLKKYAV
jgi:phosphoribosylaminoimidazole-succinocarboxamide synthase